MYDGLLFASPMAIKASTVTRDKRDVKAMMDSSSIQLKMLVRESS